MPQHRIGWMGLFLLLATPVFASVVVPEPGLPRGCADGEVPKWDITLGVWECATDASGGAGGTPGGSDTQVQYNDAGAFGGDAGLTYNETTNVLTVTGGVTGNAATASALAANGANCGAGNANLGSDAVGAAEGCFDVATQVELDAHIDETADAHMATAIGSTTFGTISSTTVQAAMEEVHSEASAVTSTEITDNEIVNADVNASAAIAESKLALNFPTHVNEVMGQESLQTLVEADDIEVTATLTKRLTVPVIGNGGPVTLTSDPQVTAGSDTQVILIYGTSETETVSLVDGAGIMLCGSSTDTYIISSAQSAEFQYDLASTTWRQLNCKETVDGEIPVGTPIETAFDLSTTGHINNSTPAKFFGICNDLNPLECYGFEWQMGILYVVRPEGEISTILDDNSPMTVRSEVGAVLAKIENDGTLTGTAFPVFACNTFENVTGSFDNLLFVRWPYEVTVTGIDVVYQGSAPTLAATFTLADGDGNAMTIAGTSPTAVARTAIPTTAAVTDDSASQLSANETLLISTSNTPNPLTDTYQVCVHGKRR